MIFTKENKPNPIYTTLIFTLLCFTTSYTFAQKFEWANQWGSSNFNMPTAIALDGAGHTIVTGGKNGSPIDPYDIFIAKFGTTGNLLWSHSFGSTGDDWGRGIITDASNNIYIVGEFRGTIDFDPSLGVDFLTSSQGGFIQKLDAGGNLIWVKKIDGAYPYCIQIDPMGDLVITGHFDGVVDFDPSPADTLNLTASLQYDLFIQKLDTAGNLIWARDINALGIQTYPVADIDNLGNIHINSYNAVSGVPVNSFVSTKLNSQGTTLYLHQTESALSFGVQTDQFNNVYTIGVFRALSVDFNPFPLDTFNLSSSSNSNLFIQKLNSFGIFETAKILCSTTGTLRPTAIRIDQENNIYITGSFSGNADFDPGTGVCILSAYDGYNDAFIQKLDSNFNLIWVKQLSGNDQQEGSELVLDSLGNIYTAGFFHGTVDFDPNSSVSNLVANAFYDVFVQKLSQCASSRAFAEDCESYTWTNGETYYSSNYTATQVVPSYLGCDSIITLNLTITKPDTSLMITGNSLISNTTGATFRWLNCDSSSAPVLGATDSIFSPNLLGNYAVEVTKNGCIDTSECVYFNPVSVQKINNPLENVSIFPNPSNGQYTLDLGYLEQVSIRIMTLEGKIVYTENNINEAYYLFELKQPNGIYIIEVKNSNSSRYFKLIKSN